MGISSGKASVHINLGRRGKHETPSLRRFPVQAGHFSTGGLLNEPAVGFCFDGPGQREPDLILNRWGSSLGRGIYRREAPRRREVQLYDDIRKAGWWV